MKIENTFKRTILGRYFFVTVSPMLSVPHQLVGAPLGYSVTLECHTEAHPTSLNFWKRNDSGPMITDSGKYKTTITIGKPSYKVNMALTIYNITVSSVRIYYFFCISLHHFSIQSYTNIICGHWSYLPFGSVSFVRILIKTIHERKISNISEVVEEKCTRSSIWSFKMHTPKDHSTFQSDISILQKKNNIRLTIQPVTSPSLLYSLTSAF